VLEAEPWTARRVDLDDTRQAYAIWLVACQNVAG
jgi:hypothetical protein